MNRIFNEILYLLTRAQGSEMPWWIVGAGWHWCLSFNITKLLKLVACLIFRVVNCCALLCSPSLLLYSFWKALRVCSVSWEDWGAGESHQSQLLPEDLQVNCRVGVVLSASTARVLCRGRSLTRLEGCRQMDNVMNCVEKPCMWEQKSPRYWEHLELYTHYLKCWET